MQFRPPALTTALLLVFIAGADLSLSAQRDSTPTPPARSPREAMRGFLDAVAYHSDVPAIAFFPREHEWTWVHTVHLYTGKVAVGTWRFRASETERVIYDCGPARLSFYRSKEGQPEGLSAEVEDDPPVWREVGRNRFVPPGRSSSSPVFVEWRRENGRWVIASFGDESTRGPRLAGTVLGDVMRMRSLPDPARPSYAAGKPWYVAGEVLYFEGHRYVKYGLPRELQPHELDQIGWIGDIRVYVEKGYARLHAPAVLYVPEAADSYQPYIDYAPDNCPPE